ncbi:MAG: prepilin peptidase [Candidatus Paceibacterota bacterium]
MSFVEIYLVLLSFLLGSSLASFGCVVVERGKTGVSITGRSKCVCGRFLSWRENIPVFGYIFLRGRSICCKSKIPPHYFITELILGFFWVLAASLNPHYLFYALILTLLSIFLFRIYFTKRSS